MQLPQDDTADLLAPVPAVRTGSLVGYARVSTKGQLLDRQIHALTEARCIRIFSDKKSGKNAEREELWKALDYLREGDPRSPVAGPARPFYPGPHRNRVRPAQAFGWGYATGAGKGWVDGGSPTMGFLSGVSAGPMENTFHTWAGDAWAHWAFMLGLLGIGVALLSGVALRPAALAGTAMMALMWAAEWPPARHLSDGSPSMSTNPLIDYHVLYAAVLVLLPVALAGHSWGLGRAWARLPLVRRNRWLF
ncbi:recombinase family protein [Streptomyces finlayi]|uniref:recombinase family protein n=1 Tax=Streptomyces finlayi TaxID=67296 RepID=UPI0021562E53|nr:recombinase family protein [Streptomyces finlayi]